MSRPYSEAHISDLQADNSIKENNIRNATIQHIQPDQIPFEDNAFAIVSLNANLIFHSLEHCPYAGLPVLALGNLYFFIFYLIKGKGLGRKVNLDKGLFLFCYYIPSQGVIKLFRTGFSTALFFCAFCLGYRADLVKII